jgi:nicotinate-nucleotide adenylyltransferase
VSHHWHWIKPPGPVAPGLRIGLLGGSFNPAHSGHLHVSETALDRLGLDYVWWLVSPQNPLKPVEEMAPFAERVARARAAAHGRKIRVTGIEADLGTRYTRDTVSALIKRFPRIHFVWLMGSDNLKQLCHWRDWTAIASMLPIAVVSRPGSVLAPLFSKAGQRYSRARVQARRNFACATPPALAVIEAPRSKMSATNIRKASFTNIS